MDHNEPDGVNEALSGALRVSLTVAAQIGERVAREREQQARAAAAAGQQEVRELQNRLDAERSAARADLAPVGRPEWWESASRAQIAYAWQTAQTWREVDPVARDAGDRIHDELSRRYGIDTAALDADPTAVSAALAVVDDMRAGSRDERRRAADEEAEALVLLGASDAAELAELYAAREDDNGVEATGEQVAGREQREARISELETAAAGAADHVVDADGRAELAAALEGTADEQAVEARVLGTTNQGRPAGEAVASPPRRPARAARARRGGPTRDLGRSR
jgi:colicin import membrane protein